LGLPDTADEAACLEAARAAHQSRTGAAAQIATFAAAAGVAGNATAEQIVAAIRVGSTEVATLAARTVALETELGQLRTATLQKEATGEIDAAIKDGVPILASRDYFIALFMRDPAGTKTVLAGMPRLNGTAVKPPPPAAGDTSVATLSALDLEIATQMGVDPAKLAAYRASKAQPTDVRAA
jgi:hypothetical protein